MVVHTPGVCLKLSTYFLRTKQGQIAQIHASWTQWKNLFSFEISCRTGLLVIEGIGGSYGTETLTFYKMKPKMGVPDKYVFSWNGSDISWSREHEDFIDSIEKRREPNGNIYDAYHSIRLVYELYGENKGN